MKILSGIMVIALASTCAYAGDITAPSPQEMATLINYDRPITLTVKENGPMPAHEWGNMIKFWGYSSKTQTLYSYSIALFAGGSLFGTNRTRMETHIVEAEAQLTNGPNRDFSVETMPDGHQVYFAGIGFGPGGAMMAGFTTLPGGKYDLMVAQSVDFEDDMPADQKLKEPAKPQSSLQEIYPRIETFILGQIQNIGSSRQSFTGDSPQGVGAPEPGRSP